MKRIEDECCGCATESYPCLGSACPNRNVVQYVCDCCHDDCYENEVYEVDDQDLCEECLKKKFKKEI